MPRNTRPAIGTPSHGGAVSHPVVRNRSWWPAFTVTFLTAVYALGYLLWERSAWGSPAVRDLVGNVAFMPLNVAVLVFNALASRSPILDPRVRRALRLLAIGAAMVFIGNTISVFYLLVLHLNPTVTWADPFYLGDSLFTLAALLTFPLARRTRLERWKFGLDAAMVLVGGAVAIWYFSVRPTAAAQEHGVAVTALAFAYPLASMLILLGITTVLLRRPVDGNRLAFGLLVSGVLVGIIADLTFNFISLLAGGRSASWADAVYLICYILLIGSAELYYRRPVPGSADDQGAPAADAAGEPASLPRRGDDLLAPLRRGPRALDRAGQRPRGWCAPDHGPRGGPAAPRGPGECPASRRDRGAPERGAVPLAGAALVRRHSRHQDRRIAALRQSLGGTGVRLRSLSASWDRAGGTPAPGGPDQSLGVLPRGGGRTRRHGAGRMAVPPGRRLVAPCGAAGHQPAQRSDRPGHRLQYP